MKALHNVVDLFGAHMSARNGDKARFQKDRKRKMLRRQRIRELVPTKTPAVKKPH